MNPAIKLPKSLSIKGGRGSGCRGPNCGRKPKPGNEGRRRRFSQRNAPFTRGDMIRAAVMFTGVVATMVSLGALGGAGVGAAIGGVSKLAGFSKLGVRTGILGGAAIGGAATAGRIGYAFRPTGNKPKKKPKA